MNYSQRPTNSLNYDLKWPKAPVDPLRIWDFDYFDRFYCVATQTQSPASEVADYVELFEVKHNNFMSLLVEDGQDDCEGLD